MRPIFIIVIILQIISANAETGTNVVLQAVRTAMGVYISESMPPDQRDAQLVRHIGMFNWETQSYTNLALTVSNSLDIVVRNLDVCATNQFEKYVVMGTGWIFGDNYYLMMFDKLLDRVAAGQLTLDDLRWFNSGHHSEFMLNTLARKFDLPIVSNILDKIESAGGDTNYCNRVRSGEAKRVYDEFEAEILRHP